MSKFREGNTSYNVVIIGGGASGMTAAIAALEADRQGRVLLLESNDRVGKKILATGNGKCNFTHEEIRPEAYHTDDEEVLRNVLNTFPAEAAISFFDRLGMLSKKKNGCFYPATETASTVLDVLRMRLSELGCEVQCKCKVKRIKKQGEGYLIEYSAAEDFSEQNGKIRNENNSDSVISDTYMDVSERDSLKIIKTCSIILATGSLAGGFLQDKQESPLRQARSLGLSVTPVYPALTKCICKEDFYKSIAGVRTQARLSLYEKAENASGWNYLREEEGELQLTKEGISGIVVFQLSGDIAEKLAEKKSILVEINFLPDFQEDKLEEWLKERFSLLPERSLEDFFLGVLHKKLLYLCLKRAGLKVADSFGKDNISKAFRIMKQALHFKTEVSSTADIKQAQVCRGGILLSEFDEKLECRKLPGLFACGEILNVDGPCGGYNLHFAWASGYLAGREAMRNVIKDADNGILFEVK